jgi:1,4-alpha-glucan branching enzyme
MPYCRKSGVWPAGEEWLFEAMNETYIPLLLVLRRLFYAGIPCRVMLGVVPVLAEQLADPYMKDRFCEYMDGLIWRARQDLERYQNDPARQKTAAYWLGLYEEHYRVFTQDFHRDILGTMKWLRDEGVVELLTSAATHGFLPLLGCDSSIKAQVRLGVETFRRHFGGAPQGFWLPECAYRPAQWSQLLGRERQGIDQWLAQEGLRYFFVEGVGITRARLLDNPREQSAPSTFQGYRLASGVAVFGRNQASGEQVWSPQKGYPGDPRYLEFHQKDPQSGLRYWRVTGRPDKGIYDPEAARGAVADQARHFVGLLQEELSRAAQTMEAPVVVAPYDCELFGHWWHEGPAFLELVYRELARQTMVEPLGLSRYLELHGSRLGTVEMTASTWGLNSDFTVWQNPEHGWLWPYINSSARELEELLAMLQALGQPRGPRAERILRQLGRELLLMQGSDWPFLLFTTQAKEYANQRFHHHHQRFRKLLWAARDLEDLGRLSEPELQTMEDVDCPWPELDYNLFRRVD